MKIETKAVMNLQTAPEMGSNSCFDKTDKNSSISQLRKIEWYTSAFKITCLQENSAQLLLSCVYVYSIYRILYVHVLGVYINLLLLFTLFRVGCYT